MWGHDDAQKNGWLGKGKILYLSMISIEQGSASSALLAFCWGASLCIVCLAAAALASAHFKCECLPPRTPC